MIQLLNTTTADSKVSLSYSFYPSQNPIYVSPVGGKNLVNIQVVVSNPSTKPVTLKSAVLAFPMGQNIDAKLSGESQIPAPELVTEGRWIVGKGQANEITIMPEAGARTILFSGNPLIFWIRGIFVNEVPGTPVVTITETTDKDKNVAQIVLQKVPLNFPVMSFTATPSVLDIPAANTTIKWTVSGEGQNRTYRLRTEESAGDTYTWQEGAKGIVQRLTNTTVFFLEVIHPSGSVSGDETLQLRIPVNAVKVFETFNYSTSPSGRYAKLGWSTQNAVRCKLMMNDAVLDENVPRDTMADEDAYPVILTGDVGTKPAFEVVASGAGATVASGRIPVTEALKDGAKVPLDGRNVSTKAYITPDGNTAFLVAGLMMANDIVAVDLARLDTPAVRIGIAGASDMAITPGGDVAFVAGKDAIHRIDVATRRIVKSFIFPTDPQGYFGPSIGVTRDGKYLVVYSMQAVMLLDAATGQMLKVAVFPIPMIQNPLPRSSVLIYPGGRAAVANADAIVVASIPAFLDRKDDMPFEMNAPSGKDDPFIVIGLAGDVMSMAITPDESRLLVVTDVGGPNPAYILHVMDASGNLLFKCPVDGQTVRLMPDCRTALVGGRSNAILLDIETHKTTTLPIPDSWAIAVTASPRPAIVVGMEEIKVF